MEDKQKICDYLLPTLQATVNMSDLTDLEYIPEQGKVVATIGENVKHIDTNGYVGYFFIRRIMDALVDLEE